VERADLIVVLRDGRIVESGSHQELMRAAGEYESLHRALFNV
jgi:ABC-type multidrug transport system fused ATPase/permease subunit